MKSQHISSNSSGRGSHGPTGGVPHPRGNPNHLAYRPKGVHPQLDEHSEMPPPGADGMDVNAPVFKQGGGSFHLQHTARPYHGVMGYGPALPLTNQPRPGLPQAMRGPPGNLHPPSRLRPPRGAMPHQQQYIPRDAMTAAAQGYIPHPMQMPPPYMMGPGQYLGGPPMYGMPSIQDISMGAGGSPLPMVAPQPQHYFPHKRERKRLEIVDPKTGKPIDLGRTLSCTLAADEAKAVLSSASSTAQSTPQKKEPARGTEPTLPASETLETESKHSGLGPAMPNTFQESGMLSAEGMEPYEADNDGDDGSSTSVTKLKKASDKNAVEKAEKHADVSKTRVSTSVTTTNLPTTTPTCSTEASPPKSKQKTTFKEETVSSQLSTTISPKKKAFIQDPAPSALKQKAIVVDTNDQLTDNSTKANGAKTSDVTVTIQQQSNGKVTYTLELLMSFREQYKELPTAVTALDSDWPSMDITSEVAVSRGGSRGGRNSAGWERGDKQAGGSGRGARGGGQWARSQDLPKRGRGERGGRGGGRGGRSGPPDPPLLEGPIKPLTRSINRWIPSKNTSRLEVMKKNVNGIMNKMTREKFDRLAGQLTTINMESLEMLQAVIKIIFDKAVNEPSFCDMYADLCVHLEANWKVWSFLKIVQNDDDKRFYWTAMSDADSEVVGPFDDMTSTLTSASGVEFEPVAAPLNMKLSEVRVRNHKFIKVWVEEDAHGPRYYWSGQDLDDLGADQVLDGPHVSHEVASRVAVKTCSFKRILLNACQEEFEKDNIYEELETSFKKDKEEGKITPQMELDYEEKRLIMKLRMLGNIRFIGELYRKRMLQERIMHECIMKLMNVRLNEDGILACVHPDNAPDEESIESLAKLLTTMGKDLDQHGAEGFMPSYFHYLETKLVKDKRLSSRISFMIKDVIELRLHRWEPRRKELKQKTLNEIRKEAEREARAPPSSAPSAGSRDRGDRDHFRSDRRSNVSRDGFHSGRSTMAPVYQHSQSMSSRSASNKQVTLPRGMGARDESVKTGPSGRPAAFGQGSRQGGRGGASGSPANFPSSRRGPTGVGLKKPQSPAALAKVVPSLEDASRVTIGKKAKSIAAEYVSIVDLKEAEACLGELQKEFNHHEDVDCFFAFEILKNAVDAKDEAREKMMDMLVKLSLGTQALTFVGIRCAIEKTIELCGDLWCDVPMLHQHVAEFVVQFMKDATPTGISIDWLLGSCLRAANKDALAELIDCGFLVATLGELLKLLKAADADKVKATVSASSVTLLSVFPSYQQSFKGMQEWIKKYGIEEVLPLEAAFGLAERVSGALSYDEVVLFITKHISEAMLNDPFFASYACLFILNLSKEGELPSAERCMLLLGLCGNTDTQVRLVSAIVQTRTDNDVVKKLLKHLVKEGAVLVPALSKWLELESDKWACRKHGHEELGEFVAELARAK